MMILPLILFLISLPVLRIIYELLAPEFDTWRHLYVILPEMITNTILLVAGVAILTLLFGVSLAWLVSAYKFTLSRVFEVTLLLPLAVPTYVLGYVYMATFDYAGPVPSMLRTFGIGFPDIRNGYGAITAMSLVLYPYVYFMSRTAFLTMSAELYNVARLYTSKFQTFIKVVLPISRPYIFSGLFLAIMESLTDFATVRFFNFPTLSEGILRVWYGMMNLSAAIEIAGVLFLFSVMIMLMERKLRGRRRYHQSKFVGIEKIELNGSKNWLAFSFCFSVLFFAFILPVAQLIMWSIQEMSIAPQAEFREYLRLVTNSTTLAFLGAVSAVLVSLIISGLSDRTDVLAKLSTMGYSIPGTVIGIGTLSLVSGMGYLVGTLPVLIYAYTVKFITVSYGSIESASEKINISVKESARLLAGKLKALLRVEVPLMYPGIVTGFVLVFVDVMKELPITLILRPFGYDTLAIWVYQMASESLWGGAALPALTIVLIGVIPVLLLRWENDRAH